MIEEIEEQTNASNVRRAYLAGWINDQEMASYFHDGYYERELDEAFRGHLIAAIEEMTR